jgi:transcription antitermination factor NusG
MDWLSYARTGREFEVFDDLAALSIQHWRGERIEFQRRGYKRRAEPFVYPVLPNYVWITLPDERKLRDDQITAILRIEHLARTFHALLPQHVEAFQDFRRWADTRLTQAHAATNAKLIAEYNATGISRPDSRADYAPGDLLEIRSGPLRDQLVRFRSLVEGAERISIRADVVIFGRQTTVDVDPLNVKRKA